MLSMSVFCPYGQCSLRSTIKKGSFQWSWNANVFTYPIKYQLKNKLYLNRCESNYVFNKRYCEFSWFPLVQFK